MRWTRPWRRPKTRGLALVYDEGWNAAEGAPCPYRPLRKAGDGIRAWLWTQGAEDRSLARSVAELL